MAFPWDICRGSSAENDRRTTSRIAVEECHGGLASLLPCLPQPVTVLVCLHPALPGSPSNSLGASLSRVSVSNTALTVWVKVTGTWGRKDVDGQEDLILSQREERVCRCSVSTGSEVWRLMDSGMHDSCWFSNLPCDPPHTHTHTLSFPMSPY